MRMSALEPGKAQLSVSLTFDDGLRPAGCPPEADLPTKAARHVTVRYIGLSDDRARREGLGFDTTDN